MKYAFINNMYMIIFSLKKIVHLFQNYQILLSYLCNDIQPSNFLQALGLLNLIIYVIFALIAPNYLL